MELWIWLKILATIYLEPFKPQTKQGGLYAANNGVNVEVSSYTQGGTFQSGTFAKLADVLRHYNVDQGKANENIGDDGEERRVTAAMNLIEGDTIVIMKAKNKSGR